MDLPFEAPGTSRAPGLQVFANGGLLAGALSAEINATGFHSADRFRVAIALSAVDPAWFAAQSDIVVDVQIGLDGSWRTLAHGLVDCVAIDPIAGLLHLDGRDLTAALIATRTSESFANHTASEIAALLAGRHGMVASVTPTSTPVGRYYQSEHDRNTLNQFARVTTEWDLLVFLAQQEGFDVYVDGVTLNFNPPPVAQTANWALTPADCIELRMERALTLASDIAVTVRSWNSREQSACVQTAQNTPAGATGASQQYVFVRPNMTQDQALQFARTMLADLAQHERTVFLTMPGDLTMSARDGLTLSGTGTAFDQAYRIARLDRTISAAHGFVQHIQAKSASASGA